jgi:allantoinase
MLETWSDGEVPNYAVMSTPLKGGVMDHAAKAWSTYGGRVGVWRVMNVLERLGITGTFFVNARCTEEYPDAVRQIVKSGHDVGAHAYTQDQMLAYMSASEQEATIRQSIDLLEACGGKKVTGWASPVIAFTPETAGLLAKAGLRYTNDVTYEDLPIKIQTPFGPIAGIPTADFADNYVLRANPRNLHDALKGTIDHLVANEPLSMTTVIVHCHFGGRALVTAVLEEALKYMSAFSEVWFARHDELATWALEQAEDVTTYRERYFMN